MSDQESITGNPYIAIKFQEGPVKEHGKNGCQIEDVIEVLIVRLHDLNKPPYDCKENEQAIRHLRDAFLTLGMRTCDRVKRGVEGTSKP